MAFLFTIPTTNAMAPYDAALQIRGYAESIPRIANYCVDNYQNMGSVEAAGNQWRERHEPLLEEVNDVISRNGGIPKFQKDLLDKIMRDQVVRTVTSNEDPVDFCLKLADKLSSGSLDVSENPNFDEAIRTIVR